MKFFALIITIIPVIPLVLLIRSSRTLTRALFVAAGLSPYVVSTALNADLALLPWDPLLPGYVFGLEISLIDILGIILYFVVSSNKSSIRFRLPFFLYLAAIIASMFQSQYPIHSLSYVAQFLRVFFLMLAVAKACVDEDAAYDILTGMSAGLAFQLSVALWQVVVENAVQPTGTFAHQNTLGMSTHFVVAPSFVLLLAGARGALIAITPFMGGVVAAITASRGTLVISLLGLVTTYSLSVLRHPATWKLRLGLFGLLALVAMAPLALSAFHKRLEAAPLTENLYDERAAFNRTALLILEDHPFGIGVNHYALVASMFGYSERGGVARSENNLRTNVHNAFLLTAAEAGYFGIVTFLLMLLTPVGVAFRYCFGEESKAQNLLMGCGIALLMVYMHSFFEFLLLTKDIQYMWALVSGMIFGLAHQARTDRLQAAT